MSRLYLVRRSLETYLGPMKAAELVQSYKRLEFGLQDEVASSCGTWVSLEDVPRLKRHYPELAKVVAEDFLGGWGVSAHSDKSPIVSSSSSKSGGGSSSKNLSMYMLMGVFVVGVIVAFSVARSSKFASLIGSGADSDDVAELLQQGKDAEFQDRMRTLMPQFIAKAGQSRKVYSEWVPYLRAYAYKRDGVVDGFNAKLLRGMETYAAPNDCSLATWKGIWRDNAAKLQDILDGKPISQFGGSQILMWDTNWIRRRQKTAGWIYPQSYYEACLLMSVKAADELLTDHAGVEARARLNNMINRLGRGTSDTALTSNSLLAYLTCLDRANTPAGVTSCVVPPTASADWKNYLNIVRTRVEVQNILRGKSQLSEESLDQLLKARKILPAKDPVTQFSYQPELDYYEEIQATNGQLKEAAKRVQYEYPDVQFID